MKYRSIVITMVAILNVACSNVSDPPAGMDKKDHSAYFVFNYRVTDGEVYGQYIAEVPKTLEAHGAEVIAADFASDVIEGDAGHVTVVLRFSSKEAAENWYNSPQYQEIAGLRLASSDGIATLINAASND